MQTTLIIDFQVKPDRLADFKNLLRSVRENLPGNHGCEDIRILENVDDSCCVTLVENWTSRTAHQAYFDGIVGSGDWNVVLEHLSGAPVAIYYAAA